MKNTILLVLTSLFLVSCQTATIDKFAPYVKPSAYAATLLVIKEGASDSKKEQIAGIALNLAAQVEKLSEKEILTVEDFTLFLMDNIPSENSWGELAVGLASIYSDVILVTDENEKAKVYKDLINRISSGIKLAAERFQKE